MRWLEIWQDWWQRRVAVDIGSTRLRIWVVGRGIVVDQPSCIAVAVPGGQIVAVGETAAALVDRVDPSVKVIWPFQAGVMAEPAAAQALLVGVLRQVFRSGAFVKPIMVVNVSAAASWLDRRDLIDLCYKVGAAQVHMVNEPLAAALGAGIPLMSPTGSCVFHVGAELVQAAVLSYGRVTTAQTQLLAGTWLDKVIRHRVLTHHQLQLSQSQLKQLKGQLAVLTDQGVEAVNVVGQSLKTGSPQEVTIHAEVIRPVVKDFVLHHWLPVLTSVLAKTSPALASDVVQQGVLLTGSGANLPGLGEWLAAHLHLPVVSAEQPDQVVVKGLNQVAEHLSTLTKTLLYDTADA